MDSEETKLEGKSQTIREDDILEEKQQNKKRGAEMRRDKKRQVEHRRENMRQDKMRPGETSREEMRQEETS